MSEKLIVLLLCKGWALLLLTESSRLPTAVADCPEVLKMHLLPKEVNEYMVNCGLKEKFLVKTLTSKSTIFLIT